MHSLSGAEDAELIQRMMQLGSSCLDHLEDHPRQQQQQQPKGDSNHQYSPSGQGQNITSSLPHLPTTSTLPQTTISSQSELVLQQQQQQQQRKFCFHVPPYNSIDHLHLHW